MATEELNEEQQQPPVEEGFTNVEGFSCGPHDTSVLRDFENHIALRERPQLKLSSHGRQMAKFGRPALEIEGLVAANGLREMAITLDDMALLLHVPIIGAFHSFEQLHVDDAINMLVELLKVSAAEARAEMIQCHGSYVQLSWLQDVYQMKIEVCHWIVAARAYLLHLLGCTRFANKSDTHVHEVFLDAQGILGCTV
ncbi:hypothetical protein GYH30_000692 [Glycine max]|nr:hypothetical protein GYH30_000692 [Glycine max]